MAPNSYRPDLPDAILYAERAWIVGDAISQMVFGAVCAVYAQTIYLLLYRPRKSARRNWYLVALTSVVFALDVIFVSMDLNVLKSSYIDNRNFPGGPLAHSLSQYGQAITVVPNACAVVTDWLASGFLLYRCLVIFRLKFHLVALPVLMYLGSVVTGILLLFESSRPGATFFTQLATQFGLSYFSLVAALNVLITVMIATHLLICRRAVRRTLGPGHEGTTPYVSIAAMLVESSALYAVTVVIFIVPYGLGSSVSYTFLPLADQMQILALMLIILRVTMRAGSEHSTAGSRLTSIKFQSPMARETTDVDISEDEGGAADGGDGVVLSMHPSKKQSASTLEPFTSAI